MNLRDIDLNLLHIFDTIYQVKNISRAADQLGLSQPGMSHALARLRKQLDDPLFVRKGNGVEPTTKANKISGPIRIAIEQLSISLQSDPVFDPTKSEYSFRLMLAEFTESLILPHLFSKLGDNRKVTFELVHFNSVKMEDALMAGTLDAAVAFTPHLSNEIKSQELFPIDPVLMFRTGHPIAQELDDLSNMQRYPHIAINLRADALKNFDKIQLNRHHDHQSPNNKKPLCLVNTIQSIPPLLEKSDYLGFVPALYAKQIVRHFDVQYHELPFKIVDQSTVLSWHVRHDNEPAHKWLRDEIQAVLSEHNIA